jgi:hypothetical protein
MMNAQLSFFDAPPRVALPAHQRTDTSVAAAVKIRDTAPRLRRLVYEYIAAQGQAGATDQECQEALGLASNTQGPRRIELTNSGHVRDSGQRRPTRSGRGAIVWIATEKPL